MMDFFGRMKEAKVKMEEAKVNDEAEFKFVETIMDAMAEHGDDKDKAFVKMLRATRKMNTAQRESLEMIASSKDIGLMTEMTSICEMMEQRVKELKDAAAIMIVTGGMKGVEP